MKEKFAELLAVHVQDTEANGYTRRELLDSYLGELYQIPELTKDNEIIYNDNIWHCPIIRSGTVMENKMEYIREEFETGSYLSRNGYYQISYNEENAQMELDYYHYYISVVKDRQMKGELYIWPYPDGTLYVSPCKYWVIGLNKKNTRHIFP